MLLVTVHVPTAGAADGVVVGLAVVGDLIGSGEAPT